MGYTKIVQFGDTIEIYEYAKPLPDHRPIYKSPIRKKRDAKLRAERKLLNIVPERSKRSVARTKRNFFRMCHHNNLNASAINFLTITFIEDHSYLQATHHVQDFFKRIKEHYPQVPLRYISVPELTKKGRYHFHCLLYDLPSEISERERATRNFQRLFRQGYIDLGAVTYTSEGLAGYMAKYMAKALQDHKNEAIRGYTCSRNILKFTEAGSNKESFYSDIMFYTELELDNSSLHKETEYETIFLGRCLKSVYKNK